MAAELADRLRRPENAEVSVAPEAARAECAVAFPSTRVAIALRAELEAELTLAPLRAALADGPPRGMDWPSFAFVLRAAEPLPRGAV